MKIKKISQNTLNLIIKEKVALLFGKADPSIVSQLSTILKRELDPKKDTEDYNLDLISVLIDKHAKRLMEAGVAEVKNGDVLRMDSVEQDQNDLQEAINSGQYKNYPFNHNLEKEMRSYFLVKTEKSDSFKELIHEFYTLATKYMTPAEIEIIKRVIKAAEPRIFKETLQFINPMEGQEQGTLSLMSSAEKKVLGFSEEEKITVDTRKDNHDLLALKELVMIMRGSSVHPLSIGPGFFSKYIPELKEEGFLGVITEVIDEKLSKIQLVTMPGESEFKDKGYDDIVFMISGFSPLTAAALVTYNVMTKQSRNHGNGQDLLFHEVQEDFFDRNIKLYVVVDGMVSGPKSKGPLNYSEASLNNLRIPVAETFLIEKQGEELLNTRIYFSAYTPSLLHPLLQHGSVNYGVNDMSFHSCQREETPEGDKLVPEEYKQYLKARYDKGEHYEPGDVAAQLHSFPKRADGKVSVPTDMFLDQNNKAALENANGMFDYNGAFLSEQFLKMLPIFNFEYVSGNAVFCMKELLKNSYPLTHRWLVSRYMMDSHGITSQPQETFYRQLVTAVEENNLKDIIKLNADLLKK